MIFFHAWSASQVETRNFYHWNLRKECFHELFRFAQLTLFVATKINIHQKKCIKDSKPPRWILLYDSYTYILTCYLCQPNSNCSNWFCDGTVCLFSPAESFQHYEQTLIVLAVNYFLCNPVKSVILCLAMQTVGLFAFCMQLKHKIKSTYPGIKTS